MSLMLEQLRQEGFHRIDLELAALLRRLAPVCAGPGLGLAAALASAWRRNRHTCLPLDQVAGQDLGHAAGDWGGCAPALAEWRAQLLSSGLVSRGGPEEAPLPLVLDDHDRLYLERMHRAEGEVAAGLLSRLAPQPRPLGLEALLEELAPPDSIDDEQRQALLAAFSRDAGILTGGPGTGKTSTLGRLLALALALEPDLRLRLAAPTGKAAARMQEALAAALPHLPERLRAPLAALPRASTLHRLLQERPPIDWLVIDEASMIDLPLMARVLEMLPAAARLLLIGDADQLASVEAGAVLAELVEGLSAADPANGALSPVTRLRLGRRFAAGSPVGSLAEAVRMGDVESALGVLDAGSDGLRWIRPGRPGWNAELSSLLEEGSEPFRQAPDAASALAALEGFRVVCAQRSGRLGLEGLNAWCERRWLRPGESSRAPILVRANDRVLGLANGDSGVLEGRPGAPGARCLLAPEGVPRDFAVAQLPAFDTAWAITVHQSQGSEMDEVLLILPEAPSPLLCQELLYTGLTRARERVTLLASEAALLQAITTRAERSSGLADRLRSL